MSMSSVPNRSRPFPYGLALEYSELVTVMPPSVTPGSERVAMFQTVPQA